MWPTLLDMTKEESIQHLRNLELEAYSHLVSALRAQGPLNSDKRKLLKETSSVLNITQERHKAEIRRAISDEKLNTIAYHITGQTEAIEDWAQEGRRLIPLLPRMAPQTAYSAIADEIAENANQINKQLPSPSSTERKRLPINPSISMPVCDVNRALPFRIPEPPKTEESKKRKLPLPSESSLAQHLLGPKMSRIQQLYRQKTKAKSKEPHLKFKNDLEHLEGTPQKFIQHQVHPSVQHATKLPTPPSSLPNGPKINVLQNISIQPPMIVEDSSEQSSNDTTRVLPKPESAQVPLNTNENQAPRNKLISNLKTNSNVTFKQTSSPTPSTSKEVQKTIKMCSTKKPITKTVSAGQKLIVVSNAQTIPSNSILQRTLTIPFVKNISVKNFEKFKIVTTSSSPSIQMAAPTNVNSLNSVKHKVVTVRTNPGKKVIPLSQLQVLNSKGSIKVLPLGGKIVGKTVTTSSPLYIMNTVGNVQSLTKSTSAQPIATSRTEGNTISEAITTNVPPLSTLELPLSPERKNGKSSTLEDILKESGIINEEQITEDLDNKNAELTSPNVCSEEMGDKNEIKNEDVPMDFTNDDVNGNTTIEDCLQRTSQFKGDEEKNETVTATDITTSETSTLEPEVIHDISVPSETKEDALMETLPVINSFNLTENSDIN